MSKRHINIGLLKRGFHDYSFVYLQFASSAQQIINGTVEVVGNTCYFIIGWGRNVFLRPCILELK